jgi:hypothetical protein
MDLYNDEHFKKRVSKPFIPNVLNFCTMSPEDHELVQGLIQLLKKHGKCGFVGTFYGIADHRFETIRLVMPGYDQAPFLKLEAGLTGLINSEFGLADGQIEDGYIKDKDV